MTTHIRSTRKTVRRGDSWSSASAIAAAFIVSSILFTTHSAQRFESFIAPRLDIESRPYEPFVSRSANASVYVILLLSSVAVTWLAIRRQWSDVLVVAVGLGIGQVILTGLQDRFSGVRPAPVDSLKLGAIWQTPSGHAFGITVIATLIWHLVTEWKPRIRSNVRRIVVIIAIVISVLRILNAEHYVGDVINGALAASAWSLLCLAIRASWCRRHNERPTTHKTQEE